MPPHPPIHAASDTEAIAAVCAKHHLSPTEFAELSSRAVAAKATAYCPYSRFRVGAVALTADGVYIPGANVENACYPVGTCAERVALGRAATEGYRDGFRALAVTADVSPPVSPCGMCRQFIREFVSPETPIIMFDKNGDFVVMELAELLPVSFGPEQLPGPGGPGAVGS